MQTRHYVYSLIINNRKYGDSYRMGSVDGIDRSTAICAVWDDILRFDYEDDDFDGVVMLYDTATRERVYYFHG
jgi:hypothetical protein